MTDTKKSYMNNPALQFISSSLVEDVQKDAQEVREAPSVKKEISSKPKRTLKPKTEPLPVKKAPEPPKEELLPIEEPEEVFPMKPIYVEVRSKRVNALLQPTLYKKILAISKADGVSVNETIHRALEQFVLNEAGKK